MRRFYKYFISLIIISSLFFICHSASPLVFSQSPSSTISPPTPTPTPIATDFVSRQGNKLYLNGTEFRFVGFNYYNAAANSIWDCGSASLSDEAMDTMFNNWKQFAGATVVRFFPFQKYFVNSSGSFDWSGFDRVISFANKYGMKVLPALEDSNGYCTVWGTGGLAGEQLWAYNNGEWYKNAATPTYKYFTTLDPNYPHVPLATYLYSFYDYVTQVVTHYKLNTTILGWEIMNEGNFGGDGGADELNIANTYSTLIKSIDHNHLVTYGTQSEGEPGTQNINGTDGTGCSSQFAKIYSLKNIDFVEGHDYGHDSEPLPGSSDGQSLPGRDSCGSYVNPPDDYHKGSLACSMSQDFQCPTIYKPFIIGESGMTAPYGSSGCGRTYNWTFDQRAQNIDAKIKAAFDVGVSGYLIWEWNAYNNCGYSIYQTSDPVLPVMIKYSKFAPGPTPTGDVNGDGKIDEEDLFILLQNYLTNNASSDLNKDGIVNMIDGTILIGNFGK
jgi:mannan endo-1,4-beta-mannosidase